MHSIPYLPRPTFYRAMENWSMRMTLEQAKALRPGQTVHHRAATNSDGTPQRWKVNGQVKTWKRSPERVQVPVKHGLYRYGYITESDLAEFDIPSGEF